MEQFKVGQRVTYLDKTVWSPRPKDGIKFGPRQRFTGTVTEAEDGYPLITVRPDPGQVIKGYAPICGDSETRLHIKKNALKSV